LVVVDPVSRSSPDPVVGSLDLVKVPNEDSTTVRKWSQGWRTAVLQS